MDVKKYLHPAHYSPFFFFLHKKKIYINLKKKNQKQHLSYNQTIQKQGISQFNSLICLYLKFYKKKKIQKENIQNSF